MAWGTLAVAACSGHMGCAANHENARPTAPVATASTVELSGLQARFAQVANRVSPSIVAISSVGTQPVSSASLLIGGSVDGPRLAAALDRVSRTVGTGFIIAQDGYIVTDEHVVSEAEQIWITTDDQKVYPAMIVGTDPRSDLAVLKIPATGLKPVQFASPDSAKRGQWCLTLGNPYGLATGGDLALSVGVVSATNRSLVRLSSQENRLYSNLIQTTAEINPGNSGGPLFDLDGKVMGINAAVVLPQKNTNGIGFAFTVNDGLMQKIRQLGAGEIVNHAYLGVSVSTADTPGGGAHIDSVQTDGPAASAQLHADDVVTRIGDVPVADSDAFARAVSNLQIDKGVKLSLLREGGNRTITVTPQVWPSSRLAVCRAHQRLYWACMVLTPAASGGYAVKSITAGSPYAKQGVHEGTVVTGVGGKNIQSLEELQMLLARSGAEIARLDTHGAAGDGAVAGVAVR